MGFSNSYALLMPVPAPLPIVSIKIGYNDRQEYSGNQGVHKKPIKERQVKSAVEY